MPKFLRFLLFPIAAIHSAVVFIRNRAYDWGILPSFDMPIYTIVIGNLAMGGTGKTPLTAWLLSQLSSRKYQIAFLSRGYGRSTTGLVEIKSSSLTQEVGDEPLLIRKAVPTIPMLVCENRVMGVEHVVLKHPHVQAIVLDDGYQHRRLKAHCYILTTSYNSLYSKDFLFPSGYLRDNRREARRASAVVVTKCPKDLRQSERQQIIKQVQSYASQRVFFTTVHFGKPLPIFPDLPPFDPSKATIAFSGLARNEDFKKIVETSFSLKKFKDYPDHHQYGAPDVALFEKEMHTFGSDSINFLTTEKDAVKWLEIKMAEKLPLYYLPMTTAFLDGQEEFLELVTRSIR